MQNRADSNGYYSDLDQLVLIHIRCHIYLKQNLIYTLMYLIFLFLLEKYFDSHTVKLVELRVCVRVTLIDLKNSVV
jgi:hypothetical protein